MAAAVQIEKPLQSGATDNPDAPQPDVARNEASSEAAGFPVRHIEGLPEGATVRPLATPKIQGLPEGATVRPIVRPDFAQNPPGVQRPDVGMQQVDITGKPVNTQAALAGVPGGSPNVQPATGPAADIAMGMGKGAGETLHTAGAVAGKVLPQTWGDQLGLPTSFKEPDYLKSENGYETAGKVGENIAEFVLGDEALKGLALTERIGLAQKLAGLAKNSPYLAKILELGVNASRTGTVGGVLALAHGATPAEAGEAAIGTGLLGGALELPGALRDVYTAPVAAARTAQEGIAKIAGERATEVAGKAIEATPTAADPYALRAVSEAQVGTYKEGANELDRLSAGKFSQAQEDIQAARNDFSVDGRKAYREATDRLEGIVNLFKPALTAKGIDADAMNASYRAAMANTRIASKLMPTTESAAISKFSPEGGLASQVKHGKQLQEAILDLAQNEKDLLGKAGYTSEDINNMTKLARAIPDASGSKGLALLNQILGKGRSRLPGIMGELGTTGLGGAIGYGKGADQDKLQSTLEGAAIGAAFPMALSYIIKNPKAMDALIRGDESAATKELEPIWPKLQDLWKDQEGSLKIPFTGGRKTASAAGLTETEERAKAFTTAQAPYTQVPKVEEVARNASTKPFEVTDEDVNDFLNKIGAGHPAAGTNVELVKPHAAPKFTGAETQAAAKDFLEKLAMRQADEAAYEKGGGAVSTITHHYEPRTGKVIKLGEK
jgi:hypothetical protein